MRMLKSLAILLGAMALSPQAYAAEDISSLPRSQTLILENPEGTVRNPGWFNIWAANGGGWSTGLQQLGLDTFWYIDPDFGRRNRLGGMLLQAGHALEMTVPKQMRKTNPEIRAVIKGKPHNHLVKWTHPLVAKAITDEESRVAADYFASLKPRPSG